LPKTDMIFGRKSRPRSHWIYRVPSPKGKDVLNSAENARPIVEIRGNGQQTVFPGSEHESGEAIEFDSEGAAGTSSWEELTEAAARLSIATILFKSWKQGRRHQLALATAGLFATARWAIEDAKKLIVAVSTRAGDENLDDRLGCVRTTYERHQRGEAISWRRELVELLGDSTTASLAKWSGAPTADAVTQPLSSVSATNGNVLEAVSTDAKTARTFADVFKDRIKYCDDTRSWYARDRQLFRPTTDVHIQGIALRFLQEMSKKVKILSTSELSLVRNLESRGRINCVVELSRSFIIVKLKEIDADHDLVGTADGEILGLYERKIISESPAIVSKAIGAKFDTEAECPEWLKFLNRIFENDPELIAFIQRAVGYSLTGETCEQCLFLLVGTGANGKTTFVKTLQRLFGDYAATTPMHTLMCQRYGNECTDDLASLVGKRFVAATEGETGQRLAEAKIKLMVGGDKIACRHLYERQIDYLPQFKLWLATNNLPKVTGTDEAIWRRIRVIEFPVTIPVEERDPRLADRLKDELPGILNWALDGLAEWASGGLKPPATVSDATGEYRAESDTLVSSSKLAAFESPKRKHRPRHSTVRIPLGATGAALMSCQT
jgi:putative DNA primase/helicase